MADREYSPNLGLITLDIADVPFGYPERVEFAEVTRANHAILDSLSAAVVGTTGSMVLHVETTGNDTIANGSVASPYATPAGALAALKTLSGGRIRHQVDIVMGLGNFPGFNVSGFWMDPVSNLTACGIRIYGTLVNATLASGNATGTATVTQGNVNTAVFAVMNDLANNLTVDDLKGKLVEMTSGTNVGSVFAISSNTATSLTLAKGSALGAGTYALREWGTVITTQVNGPLALPVQGVNATPYFHGIGIYDNVSSSTFTEIRIENLKVAMVEANNSFGISADGPCNVTVDRCGIFGKFTTSALSAGATSGIVSFLTGVIQTAAGTFAAVYVPNPSYVVSMNQSVILCVGAFYGVYVVSGGFINAQQVFMESASITSFYFPGGQSAYLYLVGSRIKGATGILARSQDGSTGGVQIYSLGLDISTPAGVAVNLQGGQKMHVVTLSGTGNAIGLRIDYGASIRVGSASTITGTTEVQMDGTNTDLATMRAQSPKVLATSYGSMLTE